MQPQPTPEEIAVSRRSLHADIVDRAFPALRQRNYRLFFFGQLISLTGTWTQQVAQGWLVWTLSHSALTLGVIAGIQSAPVLLFSLGGGLAADRIPRRLLLLITQTAAMLLALILAVLTFTGTVGQANPHSLLIVGVVAFGLGVVNAFDAPGRQAFVVDLVGKKHLLNAISLNSSVFNGARILGPALAGLLIGLVGVSVCFAVNALSFAPVILSLYLIRVKPQLVTESQPRSILGDLRDSLAYSWREPLIRDLYLTVVAISLMVFSYVSLLPLFADQVLRGGPSSYSVLTVAGGCGALLSALSLAVVRERQDRRGAWIVATAMAYCLAIGGFALSRWLPLSAALLMLGGFTGIGCLARINTALHTSVPDELRGRVLSIYVLLLMGLAPVGALQVGALAHLVGAPVAVAGESFTAFAILLALHYRRAAVRRTA